MIVVNRHDLVWAQEQAEQVGSNTLLYLQPEWSKKEKVQGMMAEFVADSNWLLSEQTHKYLGIR